jgi:hypothetical protein
MVKNPFKRGETNKEDHEPLVPTPIPALVVILLNKEKRKGSPLTEGEVIEIRDKAACIMLPLSEKRAMEEARGYADIDPEFAQPQWQEARRELLGNS